MFFMKFLVNTGIISKNHIWLTVFIIVTLFAASPTFVAHAQSENTTFTESNLDLLGENLLTHDELSSERSTFSFNIALFALSISLTVSIIAGFQAYRNTQKTKDFIEHSESQTQNLVTVTRYLQEANSEFRNENYE